MSPADAPCPKLTPAPIAELVSVGTYDADPTYCPSTATFRYPDGETFEQVCVRGLGHAGKCVNTSLRTDAALLTWDAAGRAAIARTP